MYLCNLKSIEKLKSVDPEYASKLSKNDYKKLSRAYIKLKLANEDNKTLTEMNNQNTNRKKFFHSNLQERND